MLRACAGSGPAAAGRGARRGPRPHAQDPTHWRGVAMSRIPIPYYQGMASDPDGDYSSTASSSACIGPTTALRQRASVDNVIPAGGDRARGLQPHRRHHVGRARGRARAAPARVLLPRHQPDANTCHTGSIGVADPARCAGATTSSSARRDPQGDVGRGLARRPPAVDLGRRRPARLPRRRHPRHAAPAAARCAPCGDCAAPCRRPASPARRSTATGCCSPASATSTFEVWSVDLITGRRRLEIRRGAIGESEGLDVSGSWAASCTGSSRRSTRSAARRPTGRARTRCCTSCRAEPGPRCGSPSTAVPRGRRTTLRFTANTGGDPVAGAVVRVGDRLGAHVDARGVAPLHAPARPGRITATASRADLRAARSRVRVPLKWAASVNVWSRTWWDT